MPTLSSSIVKHHVASMRDVEEALARQVLYGGDLATNLLELASVNEAELTHVLADNAGIEPAPVGELPRASEAVRRLVPSELALRHGLYPLEEHGGALIVAVSEPLPAEVQEDLAFALGVDIRQRAAPLVRIRQAISRDYGVTLDRRTSRLIAKLEGKPDPSPSSIPPEARSFTPLSGLPRAASVPPMVYTSPEPEPEPAPVHMMVTGGPRPELNAGALLGWARQEASQRARPRRVGPYTAAMAEKDLLEVHTRDDVLRAFFDFAAQYFEYSALFAVHGDLAEGRDSFGPGADHARVNGLGVPLDLPSSLSAARRDGAFRLTRLAGEGIDATLAKDLGRKPGRIVLLLPILLRGRCVLVLYGDHGDRDVELAQVGDVIAFAPLVSGALERIIRRKKTGTGAGPTRAVTDLARKNAERAQRLPTPSFEQRAAVLAQLVQAPAVEPSPAPAAPVTSEPQTKGLQRPEPRPPVPENVIASISRPVIAIGSEPRPAAAATGPSEAPSIDREAQTLPPPANAEQPGNGDRGEGPQISLGASELGPEFADALNELGEAPLAPSSRKVAHAARRPRPRQSSAEIRLPSVIVDLESDCRELVRRLLAGDSEAADKLVEIGEPAVSALAAAFPGPISGEPRRAGGDGPARASDHGPVLRTLARLGAKATPFVIVRTNDIDPVVRSWATRLLGELSSVEGAAAVVRRLSDSDPEVRRAALAAARLMQSHADARGAIRDELLELAASASRALEARLCALEALSDLRDARSVPKLIPLIAEVPAEVAKSAHWALVVITRQDFARDTGRWQEWWQANSEKHRIEWLIDSLMHDNADIRRAAGDELKSLTKEYFGYYDDLPKKERARAQQRYREWWESKGKARFP